MILFGYGATYAVQIDYLLVPHGRRLRDLTLGEYLSMVYGWCVERMGAKERAQFDYALTPDEVVAEEFEWLPPELQAERPPAWWALGRP